MGALGMFVAISTVGGGGVWRMATLEAQVVHLGQSVEKSTTTLKESIDELKTTMNKSVDELKTIIKENDASYNGKFKKLFTMFYYLGALSVVTIVMVLCRPLIHFLRNL